MKSNQRCPRCFNRLTFQLTQAPTFRELPAVDLKFKFRDARAAIIFLTQKVLGIAELCSNRDVWWGFVRWFTWNGLKAKPNGLITESKHLFDSFIWFCVHCVRSSLIWWDQPSAHPIISNSNFWRMTKQSLSIRRLFNFSTCQASSRLWLSNFHQQTAISKDDYTVYDRLRLIADRRVLIDKRNGESSRNCIKLAVYNIRGSLCTRILNNL